jgi:hypothetical protein
VNEKQMLAVYVFQMLDGQDAFLEDLDFQDYRLILSIPSTTVASCTYNHQLSICNGINSLVKELSMHQFCKRNH